MGYLLWILFGLITGAVVKLLNPHKVSGGILITILLGIVGAVVGGFVGTLIGIGDVSGFEIRSMLIAIGGGLLLSMPMG